jgi:hypothetical protein
MAIWQWTQSQDKPYLTCKLLEAWPHGFFTRDFWPHPPDRLSSILDTDATVHRIKQVHGNRVLSPLQIEQSPESINSEVDRPEADALISDGVQQSLWVCSADCSPVLIGDRATGRVAAIHAGWRGTALKIVPLTVDKLLAAGSHLSDLVVAIGPAIAGRVYQVSTHVAAEVARTIYGSEDTPEAVVIEEMLELEHSPLHPDPEPGRMRLDVRRVNALQLERLGLTPEQVSLAPHCTYQEPEKFFSYRRTREKKVQWSGIVSR